MSAYDAMVKASSATEAAVELLAQARRQSWPETAAPILDAAQKELDVAAESIKVARRG